MSGRTDWGTERVGRGVAGLDRGAPGPGRVRPARPQQGPVRHDGEDRGDVDAELQTDDPPQQRQLDADADRGGACAAAQRVSTEVEYEGARGGMMPPGVGRRPGFDVPGVQRPTLLYKIT